MGVISVQNIQSVKSFTSKLMLKNDTTNMNSKKHKMDSIPESVAQHAKGMLNFKHDIRTMSFENLNEQYGTLSLSLNQLGGVQLEEYNEFDSSLSQAEAKKMVSEDGYYGVKNTSQRIADFVIKGGGDDIERLKAGREGVLHGFKESEKAFGGALPGISHETLKTALEKIDKAIEDAGGSVVDISV